MNRSDLLVVAERDDDLAGPSRQCSTDAYPLHRARGVERAQAVRAARPPRY